MKHILLLGIALNVGVGVASAQLSLAEYVADVVDYSHVLSQAQHAVDGADADLRRARKGFMPSLSMGGDVDYNLRHGDERGLGWGVRADLSQTIYDGGGVRATTKGRAAAYRATLSREQGVGLDVEYDAEVAYWSLSRAYIYSRAMSDYHNIVRSLRDVVKRRFDEGYTSKSDLLQVESRLSDVEYLYSSAEQQRLVALHYFNTLRGLESTKEVVLDESILDSMYMPRRESVGDVLERHPDYAVSLSESEISHWNIRAVQSNFLPSINLGIYGLWHPNTPNVKGAGTRLDGGAVISLSVPIFHFFERHEALRSARSAHNIAMLRVEDVADAISLAESDGWTNLVASRARVEATRRNLRLARENLEISTYSYHEGLATILDVLQAQLSWLQIYENAIAAHYDYAVAIAAYRHTTAIGLINYNASDM